MDHFTRDISLQWIKHAKLTGSTTNANDQFGYSLDLKGGDLIIGAPFKGLWNEQGSACYFRFNGIE